MSVPLIEASLQMVSKELGLRYIEAKVPGDNLDADSAKDMLDSYDLIATQMHGPTDQSSDIGNLDSIQRDSAINKHVLAIFRS